MGAWLLVLAYVGLIFAGSSVPHAPPLLPVESGDKLLHALEYAGLGGLLWRAWRVTGRAPALLAFATGAAVAVADESYQRLVPGRFASLSDVVADCLGLAGAITLAVLWQRRSRNHKP